MSAVQIISLLFMPAFALWLFTELFIYLIFNPIQKKKIFQFSIQGILPANKENFIRIITDSISRFILKDEMIQKGLLNDDAIARLKPEIENQVDVFLKEKLKESFPMMHQLMGEKTLARFKEVFLAEVEQLLPVIIQKHAAGFLAGDSLHQLLKNKLNSISANEVEQFFKKNAQTQLFYVKLLAVGIGLIVGIFQILIVLLSNQNAV